jgi:hypothetical protein
MPARARRRPLKAGNAGVVAVIPALPLTPTQRRVGQCPGPGVGEDGVAELSHRLTRKEKHRAWPAARHRPHRRQQTS